MFHHTQSKESLIIFTVERAWFSRTSNDIVHAVSLNFRCGCKIKCRNTCTRNRIVLLSMEKQNIYGADWKASSYLSGLYKHTFNMLIGDWTCVGGFALKNVRLFISLMNWLSSWNDHPYTLGQSRPITSLKWQTDTHWQWIEHFRSQFFK